MNNKNDSESYVKADCLTLKFKIKPIKN